MVYTKFILSVLDHSIRSNNIVTTLSHTRKCGGGCTELALSPGSPSFRAINQRITFDPPGKRPGTSWYRFNVSTCVKGGLGGHHCMLKHTRSLKMPCWCQGKLTSSTRPQNTYTELTSTYHQCTHTVDTTAPCTVRNDGIRGFCLLCFTLAVNTCQFSVAVPQHRDADQLTLVPAWCLFKCVWLLLRFNVASTYDDVHLCNVNVRYPPSTYFDVNRTCQDIPPRFSLRFSLMARRSYMELLRRRRESLVTRLVQRVQGF